MRHDCDTYTTEHTEALLKRILAHAFTYACMYVHLRCHDPLASGRGKLKSELRDGAALNQINTVPDKFIRLSTFHYSHQFFELQQTNQASSH